MEGDKKERFVFKINKKILQSPRKRGTRGNNNKKVKRTEKRRKEG